MKNKYIIYFSLFLIIFMGIWMRIGGILSNSFPFTYDVGRDMLAVSKIVSGNPPLIGATTGLSGIFYGPWWYYILSIPFFVSGGNPQFIAFFIVLTGILTIILIYCLGKKIGGTFLGLTLAYFVSFSPVMIGISSQIWNPNLIPFFIVLVLLLIDKIFISSKKNVAKKYFVFFGLFLGLILDLEIVFGVLFIIGISTSIIILFRNKIKIRQLAFILSGFLLILLPRLVFELRHNFLMTRKIIEYATEALSANNKLSFQIHVLDILKVFKSQWDETLFGQNPIIGFGAIIILLLIMLAYLRNFDSIKKLYLKLILIILISFIIVLSLFPGSVWGHFVIGIPIFYIFIVGLIISEIKRIVNISVIPIYLMLIILFVVYLNDVKFSISLKPSWEGDAAVYRNQLAVIDYVYQNANGNKFNYTAYTPAVYDYPYQYLFSWYGKNKYGYIPSKEKADLFFLIIEPEYSRPFLLEQWFAVRKDDGKTVKKEIVKGKIIVETRTH